MEHPGLPSGKEVSLKSIKQHKKIYKNKVECNSCGTFYLTDDAIHFDEQGYGYSTKFCNCPECGKFIILKHIEDYGLNVNFDERYYE